MLIFLETHLRFTMIKWLSYGGLIPIDFQSNLYFCNLHKYQFQSPYFGQVRTKLFDRQYLPIRTNKKQPVFQPTVLSNNSQAMLNQVLWLRHHRIP